MVCRGEYYISLHAARSTQGPRYWRPWVHLRCCDECYAIPCKLYCSSENPELWSVALCCCMTQDHESMLLSVSGVMLMRSRIHHYHDPRVLWYVATSSSLCRTSWVPASITINTFGVCGMELCPIPNRCATVLYVVAYRMVACSVTVCYTAPHHVERCIIQGACISRYPTTPSYTAEYLCCGYGGTVGLLLITILCCILGGWLAVIG